MIIIIIAVIAFMTVMAVICYAALIVASHADDIADKWHEEGAYNNTGEISKWHEEGAYNNTGEISNEGNNISSTVAPGSGNTGES